MLHITLDTSIVEIDKKTAVFSCTIAGVSEVESDYANVKSFPNESEFEKHYFPWNWKVEDAKIIWVGNEITSDEQEPPKFTEKPGYIVLGETVLNLKVYTEKKDSLIPHYEQVLKKIINKYNISLEGDAELFEYKLKKEYLSTTLPTDGSEILIDESTIKANEGTGIDKKVFLQSYFAYIAQQIPPLNQPLNLSLFFEAENFSIPENATHFFICFSVNDYKPKDVKIDSGKVSEAKGKKVELLQEMKLEKTEDEDGKEITSEIKILQPLTTIESYSQEEDFISAPIQIVYNKYDSINKVWSGIPENPVSAQFTFKGNTSLSVSDVSEMSNIHSQLINKIDFGRILFKMLNGILPTPLSDFDQYYFNDEKDRLLKFSDFIINQTLNFECLNHYAIKGESLFKNLTNKSYNDEKKTNIILPFIKDELVADFSINDFENNSFSEKLKGLRNILERNFVENDKEIVTKLRNDWERVLNEVLNEVHSILPDLYFYQLGGDVFEAGAQKELRNSISVFCERNPLGYLNYKMELRLISFNLKEDEDLDIWIKAIFNKFVESVKKEEEINNIMYDLNKQYSLMQYFEGEAIESDFVTHLKSFFKEGKISLNTPENIPPPVNIYINDFDSESYKNSESDLLDEIAGHIILSRRSKEKGGNDYEEWKYLNWAKVGLVGKKDSSKKELETTYLTKNYLIPAPLPEVNDTQKTSFQLSNENLSLVAGHDNEVQDDEISEHFANFKYSFGHNGDFTLPPAPAFWYGYHYQFAGFVALNSGALPVDIRGGNWNAPKASAGVQLKDEQTAPYHHLRRVPIGLPNITTDYKNEYLKVPLLVNELLNSSEQDNTLYNKEGDRTPGEKIKAFLLCEKEQEKITIEVDKPYTNFWNWYAWKGGDAKGNKIGDKTLFDRALEEELKIRSASLNGEVEKETKNPYLWEPAIEDELIIKVEGIFSDSTEKMNGELVIEVKPDANGKSGKMPFEVIVGNNFSAKDGQITIPPGTICKISIHCKIKKEHFGDSLGMFYSWMKDHIVPNKDGENHLKFDDKHFLTNPEVIYVEAAIKSDNITIDKDVLYSALIPNYSNANEYGVFCSLSTDEIKDKQKKEDVIKKLPYFSHCELRHQAWNWNGRLFAELDYEQKYDENGKPRDVLNPNSSSDTTAAMKWEAWEFASRPDFTALVSDSNITANKEGSVKQLIFKDVRPQNDTLKAHYFRFGLTIYNRYKDIGEGYNKGIQASANGSAWKRLVKPLQIKISEEVEKGDDKKEKDVSEKTAFKLPKPAIRFAIPLTDALSVNTLSDDKVRAASMMIATYDRCFDEAGLAERFEIGIEIGQSAAKYLQAGEDPILSGKAMGAINPGSELIKASDGRLFAVFQPVGPAALTFDTNAHHPKVVGSTFILNVEDIQKFLPEGNKLNAYAMAKVAIRRVLKPEFVRLLDKNGKEIKVDGGGKIKQSFSEWSASEWVQFLPSIDSLIPQKWKEDLKNKGNTKFTLDAESKIITFPESKMPEFDKSFEDRMERYLVISQSVDDIGGQPVEMYVGVYKWEKEKNNFVYNDGNKIKINGTESDKTYGFARLMLVRKSFDYTNESMNIWKKLFGNKVDKPVEFGNIENDPLAAMPLVSRRITIRNK